jgi:hypothetical protein
MRSQHLLLMSSIALSISAFAAEPKSAAAPAGKAAGEAISSSETRSVTANDDWIRDRPARKNRVHYTFPPSAKRM